jgi:hypothetical protein
VPFLNHHYHPCSSGAWQRMGKIFDPLSSQLYRIIRPKQ